MVFNKIPLRKKIKIATYIAVIVIVSIYIVSAYITTVTGAKEKFTGDNTVTQATESDVENRMENLISANIGFRGNNESINDVAPPDLSAARSIILDNSTDRILYSKNSYSKAPMASTTKIMTFIIAVENCEDLYETVTISRVAAYTEGSTMHLAEGETISLHDLLYGLLLNSGNDAAVAIAEHIGGTVADFCNMMNDRASKIGATNTNFKSPHGLDLDGHYTTAYDLALIAKEAYKQPLFREIISTSTITLSGHYLKNTNPLLGKYTDVIGGKTGYTDGAGRCIVYFIDTDDIRAVAVLLGCPSSNDRVKDSVKLLRYITDNYKTYTLIKRGTLVDNFAVEKGRRLSINAIVDNDICVTLKKSECADVHTSYTRSGAEGLSAEGFPLVQAPVGYSDVLGVLWVKCGTSCTLSIEVTAESSVLRKTYTDHLGDMINTLPYVFG
ncbi:MAG: D-alanyl-D-alanine carboxypeptidase [Clostridiales bacterium]|nr:D-alanyl-D-alanine carboxypeptidase [Clostridiales bacterium]